MNEKREELDGLIEEFLDDNLDDEGLSRIQELVSENPEWAREWKEILKMELELREIPFIKKSKVRTPTPFSSRKIAILASAALVFFAITFSIFEGEKNQVNTASASEEEILLSAPSLNSKPFWFEKKSSKGTCLEQFIRTSWKFQSIRNSNCSYKYTARNQSFHLGFDSELDIAGIDFEEWNFHKGSIHVISDNSQSLEFVYKDIKISGSSMDFYFLEDSNLLIMNAGSIQIEKSNSDPNKRTQITLRSGDVFHILDFSIQKEFDKNSNDIINSFQN